MFIDATIWGVGIRYPQTKHTSLRIQFWFSSCLTLLGAFFKWQQLKHWSRLRKACSTELRTIDWNEGPPVKIILLHAYFVRCTTVLCWIIMSWALIDEQLCRCRLTLLLLGSGQCVCRWINQLKCSFSVASPNETIKKECLVDLSPHCENLSKHLLNWRNLWSSIFANNFPYTFHYDTDTKKSKQNYLSPDLILIQQLHLYFKWIH